MGRSIPHQRGRLPCPSFWHGGYLPISLPLPFHLVLPTMTQFHNWSHSSWGSLSASINGYRRHSLCLMYMFLLRSAAKSCYLWSSPVLSGCSGRCPWQKLQLPIFPPQGSFTGRSWHPPFSSPTEVVLHGVGLVHLPHVWRVPIHKGTPISVATRSQFQWRTCDCPCWFVTLCEGMSAMICTPPPKSLLPT